MPPLPAIVRQTCRRWGMTRPGDKILLAVSGGADSVALLEALRELAPELRLSLGVAHLDHGIRGQAATDDRDFVEALAREAGLPVHLGSVNVPVLARDSGRSLEDAARDARYRFLAETAAEYGYNRTATGHTLDDQAETVLLAMIRGSGMSGLAAIRPVSGDRIRPLIQARREDVLLYLTAKNRTYRTDETNADTAYLRNRVRHRLLPLLAAEYNPAIVDGLARQAELLAADEDVLAGLAAGLLKRLARSGRQDGVSIDPVALGRTPVALQRRIIRAAAGEVLAEGKVPLSFTNVEDVLELAGGRTGASVDLPGGLVARRRYRELVLSRRGPLPASRLRPCVEASVPGTVDIPEAGWTISFSVSDVTGEDHGRGWRWETSRSPSGDCAFRAVLDYDALKPPLTVRTRIPGDRFRPYGGPGERKLKEFLIDLKVPRTGRDGLPLLADSTGRIAAVLPLRAAGWASVTTNSSRLLVIEGTLAGAGFLADKPES